MSLPSKASSGTPAAYMSMALYLCAPSLGNESYASQAIGLHVMRPAGGLFCCMITVCSLRCAHNCWLQGSHRQPWPAPMAPPGAMMQPELLLGSTCSSVPTWSSPPFSAEPSRFRSKLCCARPMQGDRDFTLMSE